MQNDVLPVCWPGKSYNDWLSRLIQQTWSALNLWLLKLDDQRPHPTDVLERWLGLDHHYYDTD